MTDSKKPWVLVKLHHVTDGIGATVLVKLEYLNPGGSIKDRIAVKMIEEAERTGKLLPGGTIVEPTSGNTGVGLALVAQQKGYRCIFVVPDKVGEDKRAVLQAYGAEVVVTPTAVAPDSPQSYYSVSDRIVSETPGAYKPDQFSNPAAPGSHYETTGPEIWNDTDGKVTHCVIGADTGGTITGTGRYLKEVSADRAESDGGRVRTLLASRPMAWLGQRSYGVFLWHLLVLEVVVRLLHQELFTGSWLVTFVLTLAGAVVAAALTYRLLESPVMRLRSRVPAYAPGASDNQTATRLTTQRAWDQPEPAA